jgi:hypothetical protein
MRCQSLVLALVLSATGGCASLSEGECRSGDWEDIGFRDGNRGAGEDRALDHAEACAEYGVAVDRKAWKRGYRKGLDAYCTPENAVDVALSGGNYGGVCPPESDREFSTHWRAARVVFEQRQRVSSLDSRRRELEYAWRESESERERYEIRVEMARIDEQLRYERDRLYHEERRLDDFLRGVQ